MLDNETRRKETSGGRSPFKKPSWSIFNALLITLPYNLLGARLSLGLVSQRFMEFDLQKILSSGEESADRGAHGLERLIPMDP